MKINYIDPELRTILKKFMPNHPQLFVVAGSRHAKVFNRVTGDWLPLSGSCGDRRGRRNFERGLRHLAELGQGVIFSKLNHGIAA